MLTQMLSEFNSQHYSESSEVACGTLLLFRKRGNSTLTHWMCLVWCLLRESFIPLWWLRMIMKHLVAKDDNEARSFLFFLSDSYSEMLIFGRF